MSFLSDVLAATFRNATPLVYGTVGETYRERRILNLGIEERCTRARSSASSSRSRPARCSSAGRRDRVRARRGPADGRAHGDVRREPARLRARPGASLIGAAEFVNRLQYKGSQEQAKIEPYGTIDVFGIEILSQYVLTYVAFLVVVPLAWWVLMRTTLGLNIRAVGENPEAADAAGVNVARDALPGAADRRRADGRRRRVLHARRARRFTLNIIAGRGWVYIALVIFGRWRIGRGVLGALLFAFVYALQLRLRILPEFSDVPFELLLALPYVVVILALALSGRNVAYPGAYLKPYRRA